MSETAKETDTIVFDSEGKNITVDRLLRTMLAGMWDMDNSVLFLHADLTPANLDKEVSVVFKVELYAVDGKLANGEDVNASK